MFWLGIILGCSTSFTGAFAADTYASRCYECNYAPSGYVMGQAGWSDARKMTGHPKCALVNYGDVHYVDQWKCPTGVCFIRRDNNGIVYRGCADPERLPWDVDATKNCEYQGQQRALWWFCKGDLCNEGQLGDTKKCGHLPPSQLLGLNIQDKSLDTKSSASALTGTKLDDVILDDDSGSDDVIQEDGYGHGHGQGQGHGHGGYGHNSGGYGHNSGGYGHNNGGYKKKAYGHETHYKNDHGKTGYKKENYYYTSYGGKHGGNQGHGQGHGQGYGKGHQGGGGYGKKHDYGIKTYHYSGYSQKSGGHGHGGGGYGHSGGQGGHGHSGGYGHTSYSGGGQNPCDGKCYKNPSGLYPDKYRKDHYIQCGCGYSFGHPCVCCRPFYMKCAYGTVYNDYYKTCSFNFLLGYKK